MTDHDYLILEEPEFLKNLELFIGDTIPILNEIREESFGIQIKNKKIIAVISGGKIVPNLINRIII